MRYTLILLLGLMTISACGRGEDNTSLSPIPTLASVSSSTSNETPLPTKPAVSSENEKERAQECMASLGNKDTSYWQTLIKNYRDSSMESRISYSVLAAQVYLRIHSQTPYVSLDSDEDQTEINLANTPQPIFFAQEGDIRLVYPGLSFSDKPSIEFENSAKAFKDMTKGWKSGNKPWTIDGKSLKSLKGCSILPLADDSSTNDIVTKLYQTSEQEDTSQKFIGYGFDYTNTLAMWMQSKQAVREAINRSIKAKAEESNSGLRKQWVYVYCPKCTIKSLVSESRSQDETTEIVWRETNKNKDWYTFESDSPGGPFSTDSPYTIGYNTPIVFHLTSNKGTALLTNQKLDNTSTPKPSSSLVGTYYEPDSILTIKKENGNRIEGSISYGSRNLSQIAETEFAGELKEGQLSFSFEGNGYEDGGNSSGKLQIGEHTIEVELKVADVENSAWSLPTGKIIFSRSIRTYTNGGGK